MNLQTYLMIKEAGNKSNKWLKNVWEQKENPRKNIDWATYKVSQLPQFKPYSDNDPNYSNTLESVNNRIKALADLNYELSPQQAVADAYTGGNKLGLREFNISVDDAQKAFDKAPKLLAGLK